MRVGHRAREALSCAPGIDGVVCGLAGHGRGRLPAGVAMSSEEPLEPDPGEPMAGFRPDKLRKVRPSDLAVRFAFGAGVSICAAVIGKAFTPEAGGMFLAFPAILPATLTLIEKKHGNDDAVHDVRGAVIGSLGLVAFAVAAALMFTRVSAAVVLAAAAVAWAVVSVGVY